MSCVLKITKTTAAAGRPDYSKTKGSGYIEFSNGKKEKVDLKVAKAVWDKYNLIRRSIDKQKFQAKVAKSYKDMLKALKESVMQEGKETILDRIDKKIQERKNG